MQLLDPVTLAPHPAKGTDGRLLICLPPDGSAITPDDLTIYDPPIILSVWDAAAQTVSIVPYGLQGDQKVTYPTKPGSVLPVLVKQVLATGTTAIVLRGQLAYVVGTLIRGAMLDEDTGLILTEANDPLILETGS